MTCCRFFFSFPLLGFSSIQHSEEPLGFSSKPRKGAVEPLHKGLCIHIAIIHKLVLELLDFLTLPPKPAGLLDSEVEQGKQVSGKGQGARPAVSKAGLLSHRKPDSRKRAQLKQAGWWSDVGRTFLISWEDKRYSELRNGVPEVTVPSPEAVLERNVTTACLKRFKTAISTQALPSESPGELRKIQIPGPLPETPIQALGGGPLVTVIQSVVMVMLWGPTPRPPQPTGPQRLNQLKAPQGGAQMTTLEHPSIIQGTQSREAGRSFSEGGGLCRALCSQKELVGSQSPGATAGVQPSRARAQSPLAPSQGRGASRWAAGLPASSPGSTPSSCSASGRREGRPGRER